MEIVPSATLFASLPKSAVYRDMFSTPEESTWWFAHLPASPKRWGEVNSFFDNPHINCVLARMGQQSVKRWKRDIKARKRMRRHQRAMQRRHNKGK